MAGGRSPLALLRAGLVAGALALASALAPAAGAQDGLAPLLTLDQERFFTESAFGNASLARERAAAEALVSENARIEAELVAEEQALTELRSTLPPEDFAARAAAFDAKVERIRDEQDAKVDALTTARDADRQAFEEAARPVLGALLRERRAAAIIDKSLLILSASAVDVTDEAIARVNATLTTEPAP
jgi:Skp family chaperone for outer membrane proteins